MSTQVNTYVIYGVLFAYDLFTPEGLESLEPFEDSAFKKPRPFEELTAIVDGMNGEYVILGFVAQRSDADGALPLWSQPAFTDREEAAMAEKLWDASPIPEQQSAMKWIALTHFR